MLFAEWHRRSTIGVAALGDLGGPTARPAHQLLILFPYIWSDSISPGVRRASGNHPSTRGAAMLRRVLCAAVIVAFGVGLATAEEFRGSIRKVEKGKITVGMKFDKETKKFTEEKTFTVAKNVKVVKAKFN